MNRKVIIGLLVTAFIGVYAFYSFQQITPQEIENAPEWIPLETAQAQAAAEDKLIMIDIFEVGCQFCRAMEREVYPSPSVRAVLDRDFVPVKINGHSENMITFNGEQMTEQQFASEMGVTAYPFTVIMDSEGNVIDSRRGYMNIVNFSSFLRSTVEKKTQT
jgi:thioredoxin-related protein